MTDKISERLHDRTITVWVEPKHGMSLEFTISNVHDEMDTDVRDDFTGAVKWDHCVNWSAGHGNQVHMCDVAEFEQVTDCFRRVYELAELHLPSWLD